MRELPFGARVSVSFLDLLKQAAVKANAEWPGVLPCLCAEEKCRYETLGSGEARETRIDFERALEVAPVNRLAVPRREPQILIKERVWVISFAKRKHPPHTMFNLDGVELHVSERAQTELKGATLTVIDGKIVANYEPI